MDLLKYAQDRAKSKNWLGLSSQLRTNRVEEIKEFRAIMSSVHLFTNVAK